MSQDDTDSMLAQLNDSRRSFMKKGALATGALATGLAGIGLTDSGGAAAADDGLQAETDTPNGTATATDADAETDGGKALMFNDEFRPGAQFRVKSPVIEQDPDVAGVDQGAIFSDYNTRVIEYLNTNQEVYFFPAEDAEVEEGAVYELHDNFTLFSDDAADAGVIDVRFEPVPEDEQVIPDDDNRLEPQDDFDIVEGGGKALVQVSNFFPGALLEITTGVVEWTPRPDVQGSDIFSEYNTRHARYLVTGDEFLIYPAEDAEITEGGIYVIRDEFDITDPEGMLVTADLDRVNEDDLDDDLLEF